MVCKEVDGVKETVHVISGDPSLMDWQVRFKTVPLKALPDPA